MSEEGHGEKTESVEPSPEENGTEDMEAGRSVIDRGLGMNYRGDWVRVWHDLSSK